MEALARSLVATEQELGLRAGLHGALDAVARVVVLVAHHAQQEIHLLVDERELLGIGFERGEEVLRGDRRVGRVAGEQLRHHVEAAAGVEPGDRHVREDRPDATVDLGDRPLVGGHIGEAEHPFVGLGVALVRAPCVVHGLVVVLRPEGVLVQDGQVVEVEVAVVGHLPVRPVSTLTAHHRAVDQAEVLEHLVVATQVCVDVEVHAGGDAAEHDARPFRHRQWGESEAAHVDVAEVGLVEDAHQLPAGVVRPRVIRTGEASCRAAALLHHLCATVAAHVDERAQHTVVAAHEQHGRTHHVERAVTVGLAQFAAETEHQRQAPEHPVHLGLPPLRVVVVGGRYALDVVVERHGARLGVPNGPLGHRDELFSAHDRLPRRMVPTDRACGRSRKAAAMAPTP